MHTLQELRSGKLYGIHHLRMSEGLNTFPEEIFDLCDTLEILDLSGNNLNTLPPDMHRLYRLKIVFLSNNAFTVFPPSLASCPLLTMIGFKANRLEEVPEHSFPLQLRWLILTDNHIHRLPASIGNCTALQKVMLAGNRLTALPAEMAACRNIELLRISANQIAELPDWLFALPRLSWLAFAGNPCSAIQQTNTFPEVSWNDLLPEEQLGQGASGTITKVRFRNDETAYAAVKVFKGDITSDGLPADEINACMIAGMHPNLVPVLGSIPNHPEGKQALLLALIPSVYANLGGPPGFDTCTRDTFPDEVRFSVSDIKAIVTGLSSVLAHLHAQGILHGDVYAHNILVAEGRPLLGDFGAATVYAALPELAPVLQAIEVRAFSCLLEDLLVRIREEETDHPEARRLTELLNACRRDDLMKRPIFAAIYSVLREKEEK